MMHAPFWPIEADGYGRAKLRLIAFDQLTKDDRFAWDELAQYAESGAFFSHRWFLEPLLNASTRWLAVVEEAGRWLGAMAVEQSNRLGRLPMPMWRGVKDANQFLGLPLVRKGHARTFWSVLIPGLESLRSAALGLYLPAMPDDCAVSIALRHWCREDGRKIELIRKIERAAFTGGQCFQTYFRQHVPSRRRRRLASLSRQLEVDVGPIRIETVSGLGSIADWTDQFLALEQRGWKGAAKSAMADTDLTERLFRSAASGATAHGIADCVTLYAGTVPLAASIQFLDGDSGCGFKTSFDEHYARYAPGLHLLLHITKTISERPGMRFDSCSTTDQASVNTLWPERRTINDYCISLGGDGRKTFFETVMLARRAWAVTRANPALK
jgi:Acetyltransferase (GNAT) domain